MPFDTVKIIKEIRKKSKGDLATAIALTLEGPELNKFLGKRTISIRSGIPEVCIKRKHLICYPDPPCGGFEYDADDFRKRKDDDVNYLLKAMSGDAISACEEYLTSLEKALENISK